MSETPSICIKLGKKRIKPTLVSNTHIPYLFSPGETIAQEEGFMRGHGTFGDNGHLKSAVVGPKEVINKLITVRTFKGRYDGAIGDIVIGRILEVQQKRWKVETNSRVDSVLLLSSVNLPGGELRRRSVEDEHMMRRHLHEGDLISAEVQNIYSDGALVLHTRSLRYGKLGQGVLISVPSHLIKKVKTHFHNLACGVSVILGNNGFIWICPTMNVDDRVGAFVQNLDEVISRQDREIIARLRNCILALAQSKVMLYDTSLTYAYEESQKYSIRDLLNPETMIDVALSTIQRTLLTENA